jgi:hypothetical protein
MQITQNDKIKMNNGCEAKGRCCRQLKWTMPINLRLLSLSLSQVELDTEGEKGSSGKRRRRSAQHSNWVKIIVLYTRLGVGLDS